MNNYKISFTADGAPRCKTFAAESDGEAIELFEEWAERFGDIEFLSIKEVT